jgi:hypothetical protein
VDTENVQASYNAGVLKLELAKKPEAQPKQIKINVAARRSKSRSWESVSESSASSAFRSSRPCSFGLATWIA